MRALLTAAIAVISATPAIAAQTIRCTAPGKADVVMHLGAKRMLGKTVNCIDGDFITDMTPCAPRGAYGLSSETGWVPLIKIVTPAQGYADHDGGVTGYFVDGSTIKFLGGFHHDDAAKADGLEGSWQFTLDGTTDKAVLKLEKDSSVVDSPSRKETELEKPVEYTYACRTDKKKH